MPSGATNLQITAQTGGSITFQWNPPPDANLADLAFLDLATENGFVNYQTQDGPLAPLMSSGTINNVPPGTYWARVNTHYPGFQGAGQEFGPLDRGWFPSQHIPVTVDPAPPLPTGTPASNLVWNPNTHRLGWTAGHGTSPITRVSVDLSTFPQFDDILQSPFISVPTCVGTIEGFPFAFDTAPSCTGLEIDGVLVSDFYIRVNTLFGNRVWFPSAVKHIQNGIDTSPGSGSFPWLLVAGAAAVVGYAYIIEKGSK